MRTILLGFVGNHIKYAGFYPYCAVCFCDFDELDVTGVGTKGHTLHCRAHEMNVYNLRAVVLRR